MRSIGMIQRQLPVSGDDRDGLGRLGDDPRNIIPMKSQKALQFLCHPHIVPTSSLMRFH